MSRLVPSIVCKQLPICTANLRVFGYLFLVSLRKRGISLCWMVNFFFFGHSIESGEEELLVARGATGISPDGESVTSVCGLDIFFLGGGGYIKIDRYIEYLI